MSCAVPGCTNNRRFKPNGVSFHRFPQDEMLDEWLHVLCKDPIMNWIWSKNKFVCSLHFHPEDFITISDRRVLKITAVPSIFPKPRNYRYILGETTKDETKPTTSKVPPELKTELKETEYSIKRQTSEDHPINSGADSASKNSHFVTKLRPPEEENPKSPKRSENDVQSSSTRSRKICKTTFIGDVATTNSEHLNIFSSVSPHSLPTTFLGSQFSIVRSANSKHAVYVNPTAANWKLGNIKKSILVRDPLALETITSSVSLPKPNPKPTSNAVQIKILKKSLTRKLRMIDVAIATNPSRKELKANINMKRLTGVCLPFFTELSSLLKDDCPKYGAMSRNKRLLLFLIKMKWGTSFVWLASYFQINRFLASKIFTDVLNMLYDVSRQWLVLCSQSIKKTGGPFSRFKAIIDSFEALTATPGFLEKTSRSSRNTKRYAYKFLLGVSPTGLVSFVSKAQGGNTSRAVLDDICSSWLACVQEGDLVAVGRGYPELESTLDRKGAVPVPFSVWEGGSTELEKLASCRGRFERTVQKLKRFEILRTVIPDFCGEKSNCEISELGTGFSCQIDKIVHMCCVLMNHKILKYKIK